MKIEFKNRELLKLYAEAQSRKYVLQKHILDKFFMRIQSLEAADTIHDLWKTPSLKFESLKGHPNKYSVRLDKKWRLEMEIEWEDPEKTRGVIHLAELSKHYGD